jgi:rhamnosyl/mannosyltransferase
MNILHLYKDYYPVLGGIENETELLTEAQAAADHQVTALECAHGSPTCVEGFSGAIAVEAGRIPIAGPMPLNLSQATTLAWLNLNIMHGHVPRA